MRFQHFEVLTRPDGSAWELGRGAMGVTYRARDTNLKVDVALKVLENVRTEEDREAFFREARAAAALRHSNVASVHHLGEDRGQCFYAMELVEGRTLEARLAESGPLPVRVALEIALQVARALSAASREGLVHRDINPANLLLLRDDDGRTMVKMIDFGLARFTATGGSAGAFAGTPDYASPEQLRGKTVDVRSDIYSLGATLYHMLTGRPPFAGTAAEVRRDRIEMLPAAAPLAGVPGDVQTLVLRMLANDPAGRPQNPTALRIELEACLGAAAIQRGIRSGSLPPPLPVRPVSRFQARAWLMAAGAGVVFVLVLGLILLGTRRPTSPLESEPEVVPASVVFSLPSPTPGPTPTPPPPPDPMAKIDALLREGKTGEALAASLEVARAGNPEGWRKAEMAAAAMRSNAFVMTPTRFAQWKSTLEDAAGHDVVSAQMLLGEELREKQPRAALRWFQAAAENGQTEAMTQAGLMLSNGKGVAAPDLPLAVKWFERAANAGDTDAMTVLAECLIYGKGTAKDPARAAALLEAAVAFHHPLAYNLLGDLYARGSGVPRNDAEALRLFQRGAELGSGDALANLGVLHLRGQGVPADPRKAVELWKSGAARGYPACMVNLAKAVYSGQGTPRDVAAAREWFVQAARAGNPEAVAWCRTNGVDF